MADGRMRAYFRLVWPITFPKPSIVATTAIDTVDKSLGTRFFCTPPEYGASPHHVNPMEGSIVCLAPTTITTCGATALETSKR